MNFSNRFFSLLFFGLGILSTVPFTSDIFTNWDGPQFAIAITNYSIRDHFPAPPGHFLYVMAGKLLYFIFQDRHAALIALSVVFRGLNSALLYFAGAQLFSQKTGVLAAMLYICSPLFLYYGSTAGLSYPVWGFFAFLGGILFFKAIQEKQGPALIGGLFVYAILIGMRPQELFFLLPLALWAWLAAPISKKGAGLLVFTFTCLAWFMPLIKLSGGLETYLSLLGSETAGGHTRLSDSIFQLPSLLKANIFYQIKTYAHAFGLAVIPLFYYLTQFFNSEALKNDKRAQIFCLWILPCLLFWTIFNFNNGGYLIVALFPLTLLTAHFLTRIIRRQALLWPIVVLILSSNLIFYFYDFHPDKPATDAYAFQTYPHLKKKDLMFQKKFDTIKKHIHPSRSVMITTSNSFMQAMYYLPDFHVYLLDGITHPGAGLVRYGHRFKRQNWRQEVPADILSKHRADKVVFFDDEFDPWIKTSLPKQIIPIGKQHKLTIVNVNQNDKMIYRYHQIEIK